MTKMVRYMSEPHLWQRGGHLVSQEHRYDAIQFHRPTFSQNMPGGEIIHRHDAAPVSTSEHEHLSASIRSEERSSWAMRNGTRRQPVSYTGHISNSINTKEDIASDAQFTHQDWQKRMAASDGR